MPDNKVPLLSAIITAITLVFGCIFFSFSVLVALNGYSEREGLTVLGITILSQVASGIIAVIFARRMTIRLLTKSNWQNIPAVIVSVLAGLVASGVLNFIVAAIAILISEVF